MMNHHARSNGHVDVNALMQRRAALYEQLKALNEKADAEGRDLDATEQRRLDGLGAATNCLGQPEARDRAVSVSAWACAP